MEHWQCHRRNLDIQGKLEISETQSRQLQTRFYAGVLATKNIKEDNTFAGYGAWVGLGWGEGKGVGTPFIENKNNSQLFKFL